MAGRPTGGWPLRSPFPKKWPARRAGYQSRAAVRRRVRRLLSVPPSCPWRAVVNSTLRLDHHRARGDRSHRSRRYGLTVALDLHGAAPARGRAEDLMRRPTSVPYSNPRAALDVTLRVDGLELDRKPRDTLPEAPRWSERRRPSSLTTGLVACSLLRRHPSRAHTTSRTQV